MPPLTKADRSTFRKDVDFVAKDDEEQIATGIVMVPDKVDLQNDFVREDTIQEFADQFGNFVEVGEADGGVMHAAWPSEWMSLERNEVLEEAQEIGGTTAPAGAWVQEWQFNDDELWSLVSDGVLEGYSIGAIDVDWDGPYAQDELDDVAVPEAIEEDEQVWELVQGIIREVSAVDIPAVPDAQILQTKDAYEKRLSDHLGNRDGFIEEAMERGHSEAEAERLWDVLNRAVDVEGAGEPGKESFFARIGKAAFSAFTGSDDGADVTESPEAPAEKEGRTLSKQNRESLFATIDASLDVLEDANVDHGMTRFTDREEWAFDLSEHSARQWSGGGDEEEEEPEDEGEDEEENAKHATGGDTPDGSTDMSDDTNDPMEEAPEWAQTLHDEIEENSKRIEDLADDDEESKDADTETDETDEPPEWAKTLSETVEENAERIDAISKQSGYSDQIESNGEPEGDESGLDAIGKALS